MTKQVELNSNTSINDHKPFVHPDSMTGTKKAAILMLILGQERAANIFKQLPEDEVLDISKEMSNLGRVDADIVEIVCKEFSEKVSSGDGFVGNYEKTEEFLKEALPKEQVDEIMENIRGPSGRSVWAKMANMPEAALASYLKNEQPQTVAVILNYIDPTHVAKVLSLFDDEYATDIIYRILHLGPVSKEVLENLEVTLRSELVSTFGRSSKKDSYAFVAEIYNNFDRKREAKMTKKLGERDEEDMEKVNKLKFTFDDIKRLSKEDMMIVLNAINSDVDIKQNLAMALKAANKPVKEMFFSVMSKRAAAILQDEINNLGPIKLKDGETAQMSIINLIKEMGKEEEIDISPSSSDDEIIE